MKINRFYNDCGLLLSIILLDRNSSQNNILREVLIMKGINIYNRDGKILTAKIINEIGRNLSKSKGRNITFIIQGGALIKIEE